MPFNFDFDLIDIIPNIFTSSRIFYELTDLNLCLDKIETIIYHIDPNTNIWEDKYLSSDFNFY